MRTKGMLVLVLMLLAPAVAGGQANHPATPQQPPQPPPDGYQIYKNLLDKMCPTKNLEMLSPGELDDLIEVNFHDALPETLQTRLDAADKTEKVSCTHLTMGIACYNIAYIRAMNDVNLVAHFARMVCDTGIVCRAPAQCERAR